MKKGWTLWELHHQHKIPFLSFSFFLLFCASLQILAIHHQLGVAGGMYGK